MKLTIFFSVIAVVSALSAINLKSFTAIGECLLDGCEQNINAKAKQQEDPPFACNLAALTKEQRQRHIELSKQMRESVQEVRELPDGYALRFASDSKTILSLAEFVSYERLCCPFFKFTMEIECSDQPVWLQMTGREGIKEFLKTEFGVK